MKALLPVTLLLAVAATQLVLVYTDQLTPWKGGGFGMFSTLDDAGRRHVRMYVEAPGRSEEVALAPSLEAPAVDAALWPSSRHLERLAGAVAARERRNDRAVTRVRVEVWRYRVDRDTLAFTPERIVAYAHEVGSEK